MILQYIENDEVIDNGNFEINLKNVSGYARKNCRHCYGRGYLEMDGGAKYIPFLDKENRVFTKKVTIGQKVETCYCVDNHFALLDRIKSKK